MEMLTYYVAVEIELLAFRLDVPAESTTVGAMTHIPIGVVEPKVHKVSKDMVLKQTTVNKSASQAQQVSASQSRLNLSEMLE
jgi:hypothetical protein